MGHLVGGWPVFGRFEGPNTEVRLHGTWRVIGGFEGESRPISPGTSHLAGGIAAERGF